MFRIYYNIQENFDIWNAHRAALRSKIDLDAVDEIPKIHLFALAEWWKEEQVVAVVAVYRNFRLGKELFLLGGFDCLNVEAAGEQLLISLTQVLKMQGAKELLGPMLGSTWYSYAFQAEGNMLLPSEEKHPTYYPAIWERAGFQADKDFYHFALKKIPKHSLQIQYDILKTQGITIKSKQAFSTDILVRKIYYFLHLSFSQAYLFSPLPWDDFQQLFSPVCGARHPSLLWLAERNDEIVGLVFGMQNPANPAQFIMKTLARHPGKEYRKLGKIIGLHFIKECRDLGGKEMIFANAREDNFSIFRAEEQGAERVNIRKLFKKNIA